MENSQLWAGVRFAAIMISGLLTLLLLLGLLLRWTGGYAPGWILRCTSCGHTGDASKAGIIRIGARSWGKRIVGHCSQCGGWALSLERRTNDTSSLDR